MPIAQKPRAFTLPQSGELLGHVVHAFRLHLKDVSGVDAQELDGTNMRKHFGGRWLPDGSRRDLCNTVARAVLQSGLLGEVRAPMRSDGTQTTANKMLAAAVYHWCHIWDGIFCEVAGRWPNLPPRLATLAMARLLIIDLAVRLSALQELRGCPGAFEDPSGWAVPDVGKRFLEQLLKACDPSKSRDKWLENRMLNDGIIPGIQVDPRTLDHWIDDSQVPNDESLQGIALTLGGGNPAAQAELLRSLRLHYSAFSLSKSLADLVGWEWTERLARKLCRFVQSAGTLPSRDRTAPDDYLRDAAMSLVNGIAWSSGRELVALWLQCEADPLWREDLLAVSRGELETRLNACLRVLPDWS